VNQACVRQYDSLTDLQSAADIGVAARTASSCVCMACMMCVMRVMCVVVGGGVYVSLCVRVCVRVCYLQLSEGDDQCERQ